MIKILHCSDIHLSASDEKTKSYCLGVFDEILQKAKEMKTNYLIFAGDLFNSYNDLEKFKDDLRIRLKNIPENTETIFICGNHEYLHSSKKNTIISKYDFAIHPDRIVEYSNDNPFKLMLRDKIEFLAIPHNSDYSSYINWNIPEKKDYRVCIAHAQVLGLNFEGIDEGETNRSFIDPELFVRFKADLVLMGHIHSEQKTSIAGAQLYYPGSARVWRSGESGERKVALITIDNKNISSIEPINLKSAGQYRKYELPLSLDGNCLAMDEISKEWGPNDYIDIKLEGIVDDEHTVSKLEDSIKLKFESAVRILVIDRAEVFSVEGISSQAIAKKFVELWEKEKPNSKDEKATKYWLKARQMGLSKIKEALEALQW
jgi:DNA repair exonuclease SbcCD nuclease subunit